MDFSFPFFFFLRNRFDMLERMYGGGKRTKGMWDGRPWKMNNEKNLPPGEEISRPIGCVDVDM